MNRRQFAFGSAAAVSGGLFGGFVGSRMAQGRLMRFDRRLPIPPLIDAAKRGNAVELTVASESHAFVGGKPTRPMVTQDRFSDRCFGSAAAMRSR